MSSTNFSVTREVVQEIRAGNVEAFDFLFGRFREKLLVCCELSMGLRLKQKIDPEDVLQETYAEAYRLFETFSPGEPGSFYRWLAAIATNRIRNLHRHYFETEKRGGAQEVSLDGNREEDGPGAFEPTPGPAVGVTDDGPTPSRILMNREAVDYLVSLIEALPQELREVIRVRVYEGRTVEAAAKLLDVNKDTVTQRMFKALKILEAQRLASERSRG